MESNKYGFFWKLTMLISTLIKYFLFFASSASFVILYQIVQSVQIGSQDVIKNILIGILAVLFLIAGLLIKIVEHQSVIAKLNNHPE